MAEPTTTAEASSRTSPSPPELPLAERARTLVHVGRSGSLATHSAKLAGFPFASLAPYGLDEDGCPLFLFSSLAMHTQNLLGAERAALLVTQANWIDDPLAAGRASLLGPIGRVADSQVDAVRAAYLARHPGAAQWADFKDFSFFRMQVTAVYYVAGFGAMGWIGADVYSATTPDPLADHAAGILEHMNKDHADAVDLYCRVLAGVEPQTASMVGVDRLGFQIRAEVDGTVRHLRLGFPAEVRTTDEVRKALIGLLRDARARAAATGRNADNPDHKGHE